MLHTDPKAFRNLLTSKTYNISEESQLIDTDYWYDYFHLLLFKSNQPNLCESTWDFRRKSLKLYVMM